MLFSVTEILWSCYGWKTSGTNTDVSLPDQLKVYLAEIFHTVFSGLEVMSVEVPRLTCVRMFLTHRKQSVCGRCYHSLLLQPLIKEMKPLLTHSFTNSNAQQSVSIRTRDVLQVLVYRGDKRPNFGWSPKGLMKHMVVLRSSGSGKFENDWPKVICRHEPQTV